MSELNTTGYALLGLLNQHPWSAYELTRYMRVSFLRAVWPRAESRLYEGPKKLVSLGFAEATVEQSGKRSRTVYSITGKGRRALREWLKSASKDMVFEHEALVQLANCDAGDLTDLQDILTRIGGSTDANRRELLQGLDQLLDPSGQISSDKKVVINTLINSFIYETLQARIRWLEFARTYTSDWVDLEADEGKLAASKEHYRKLKAALEDAQV